MSGTFVPRGTGLGIGRCYANHMLVDMAFMLMMQMSIVQVVDMVIVHDAGMAALRTMRMIMIVVLRRVALAHCQVLIKCYLVKYIDRLLIHALAIMIKSSASALHSRHCHRGTPATTVAAGCECPPVGCNEPLGPAWRSAILRLAVLVVEYKFDRFSRIQFPHGSTDKYGKAPRPQRPDARRAAPILWGESSSDSGPAPPTRGNDGRRTG